MVVLLPMAIPISLLMFMLMVFAPLLVVPQSKLPLLQLLLHLLLHCLTALHHPRPPPLLLSLVLGPRNNFLSVLTLPHRVLLLPLIAGWLQLLSIPSKINPLHHQQAPAAAVIAVVDLALHQLPRPHPLLLPTPVLTFLLQHCLVVQELCPRSPIHQINASPSPHPSIVIEISHILY